MGHVHDRKNTYKHVRPARPGRKHPGTNTNMDGLLIKPPQGKKWALSNLTLLEDGELLGDAIRSGQARAVSDGSFKEKFGTAAWVFYHNETNATLGNGRLITPGCLNDQCAYRSELSGIYGIALTLHELASYQDFTGGHIKIACDGESALHQCFKPWDSNPLAKHFNLIQATRTAIRKTPLGWSWEHVRATKTTKTTCSPLPNSATSIWTQQRKNTGNSTIHNTMAQLYNSTGKAGEFSLEKN